MRNPADRPHRASDAGCRQTFRQIRAQEEEGCKTYAQAQIAGAVDNANRNAIGGAVLTTALGAGTGALLGGGEGARIGTAGGATAGTGVATDMSANSQTTIQQRYDVAYSQCMYAEGNQVPGMQQAATEEPPPAPAAMPAYVAPPRFDPTLVAAIQRELARIGLLSGTPDGPTGGKFGIRAKFGHSWPDIRKAT